MKYTYLLINLGCFIIPFIFSFQKKHPFYKEWDYFFKSCLPIALFFSIWNHFFAHIGIWGFNPDYIIGIYFGHLPIEEVLFNICIPYAAIFTFVTYKRVLPGKRKLLRLNITNAVLGIIYIVTAILAYKHIYTTITLTLLGIFLFALHWRGVNLYYYFVTTITVLFFLFIGNEILSYSFLKAPVVWYNDIENLGVKLFTVPLEGVFYSILLIISNIYFYERIKRKKHAKS